MTAFVNCIPIKIILAIDKMSKAKVESLRDKVDGNELDLSLSNLTEVPVKELVSNTEPEAFLL